MALTKLPWDDRQLDGDGNSGSWTTTWIPSSAMRPVGVDPSFNTSLGTLSFPNSGVDSSAFFQIATPFKWKQQTPIYCQANWCKESGTAGNVMWKLEWEIKDFPAFFSGVWQSDTATNAKDAVNSTLYRNNLTLFNRINTVGRAVMATGLFKISRISSNVADSYPGVASLIGCMFYFEVGPH